MFQICLFSTIKTIWILSLKLDSAFFHVGFILGLDTGIKPISHQICNLR